VWRAMCALLDGRLGEADELAAEALAAGGPGEAITAAQYHAVQLVAIRREQGRVGELEQAVRHQVESSPDRPAWRAALGIVLLESGAREQAAEQLALLSANGFEDIPEDGDWMTTITLLSDISTGVGDESSAAILYELLLPFADLNVVIGLAALCLGSAARFLGRLALTLGDEAAARGHLERALEANERLNAPLWLAHTRLDYALSLGRGSRARGLLEEAAETAAALGLASLARRVELARTG
jgi:tetratricopeptide (TPR) repeat protein